MLRMVGNRGDRSNAIRQWTIRLILSAKYNYNLIVTHTTSRLAGDLKARDDDD